MQYKGKVVVIAGPSGVGKNSIIAGVIKKCPHCSEVVTATTRAPRAGECDGVDYFFMDDHEFDANISNGSIGEFRVHPILKVRYGTYLPDLTMRLRRGDVAFGDFDIDGVRFLKKHFNALAIFVLPPSFDVLKKRIHTRHTGMSEEELQKRLDYARHEIDIESREYDYRIVNEEGKLDETVDMVVDILRREGYIKE